MKKQMHFYNRETLTSILEQLRHAKEHDLIRSYKFSFFCDSALYYLDPGSSDAPASVTAGAEIAKRALYIDLHEESQNVYTSAKLVEHFQTKYGFEAQKVSPFTVMVTIPRG